jgi:hypothetical protein
MNFIAKHLNLIGILLLTIFGAAAATLYFDVPARLQNGKPKAVSAMAAQYTCPMHSEIVSAKTGHCPKCGMSLVPADQLKAAAPAPVGHEQCPSNAEHESGCCAKKTANSGCPMNSGLPPGHPPIEGYTPPASPPSATNPH